MRAVDKSFTPRLKCGRVFIIRQPDSTRETFMKVPRPEKLVLDFVNILKQVVCFDCSIFVKDLSEANESVQGFPMIVMFNHWKKLIDIWSIGVSINVE